MDCSPHIANPSRICLGICYLYLLCASLCISTWGVSVAELSLSGCLGRTLAVSVLIVVDRPDPRPGDAGSAGELAFTRSFVEFINDDDRRIIVLIRHSG